MRTLFIIPARGGSKGLPGKNIKMLNGHPLIVHSLQFARLFAEDKDICVTTDAEEIATALLPYNYQVPFYRPAHLSNDTAGMHEVIRHAVAHYEGLNGRYDRVVLLQPTSPFRKKSFLDEAFSLFHEGTDMVVSVKESKANPYFNLFEENASGYLELSKKSGVKRRQDAPAVYQYNGCIYIINRNSLERYDAIASFQHVVKYI